MESATPIGLRVQRGVTDRGFFINSNLAPKPLWMMIPPLVACAIQLAAPAPVDGTDGALCTAGLQTAPLSFF
jgi:hypothetical protein